MKILALDAATDSCSAALWRHGELTAIEQPAVRDHGAQLLAIAERLLAGAALALPDLDAVAFGRGPGAFTGLRLAASVTQGLAFAAGIAVIPVSDLRALAQQLMDAPAAPARVLACQDARMGEVYWAGFGRVDGCAQAEMDEAVAPPAKMLAAARQWLGVTGAGGAGSGFEAYAELAAFGARLAPLSPALRPRAREVARLAAHDGMAAALSPELAVPVYLRDEVAAVPAADASVP